MVAERRQFERLNLSGEAIALTEDGRRLGMLAQVGGGGMSVRLDDPRAEAAFQPGRRMKLTVVEPLSEISHVIEAEVRYSDAGVIGFSFVRVAETSAGV